MDYDRIMDLVGSWLRRAMYASLAALIIPVAVLIALIITLDGGGIGGLGSIGQLFSGPALPGSTLTARAPQHAAPPLPIVPPGSLVASVAPSSTAGRPTGSGKTPTAGSHGQDVSTTLTTGGANGTATTPGAESTSGGGGTASGSPASPANPAGDGTHALGNTVVQVTGALGKTVANTGAALGQTTSNATGAVGGLLTPVIAPVGSLVDGTGAALNNTLTGTGAAAGGLVTQLGNLLGQALGAGSQ
jgi:hypothetical protein